MYRGPSARKQPYEAISQRFCMATGKMVNIIHDRDEDIWYVGTGLTIENLNEGGPFGCHTFYCVDDASDKQMQMVS